MTLGAHILSLRKAKKLSQGDLGKKIGTSGDIIGRYERGEISPSIDVAAKMADALEVSLDFLIGKVDPELDQHLLKRMIEVQQMGENDKEHILYTLDALIKNVKFKSRITYYIMSTTTKPSHIGRKIARIRELRGMKQEILIEELSISQQSVTLIEQGETLENDKLERVAKALGVSKETIENFSEEAIFNNIQNYYEGSTINAGPTVNNHCTFNPLDKLVESYQENKKLYERLVEAEKDKVSYLEKLLKK